MNKQIIKVKKELPKFLPHGWKTEVAKRVGVHRASMNRILKNKKGPIYLKVIETAKSLYGKAEN